MPKNINFATNDLYRSLRSDLSFWWPYITKALDVHNLNSSYTQDKAECGDNPTYPVFLIGGLVVKFFGHMPYWKSAFNVELKAHECLIKDETILAPKILGSGRLFKEEYAPWPYIISTRVAGKPWLKTDFMQDEKGTVAAEIGQQLNKIHKLPVEAELQHDHAWSKLDLKGAAQKSILPKHLIEQVNAFVKTLNGFDKCLVNGDIVNTHVFVKEGHLSGIIDWGDATISDRHYELGKLMDTFDWDKRLLKIMLEASNWPIQNDFPRQALGLSLYRQAVGLTQHSSFDVFYKLPDLYSLEDIPTLDDLADTLFGL